MPLIGWAHSHYWAGVTPAVEAAPRRPGVPFGLVRLPPRPGDLDWETVDLIVTGVL